MTSGSLLMENISYSNPACLKTGMNLKSQNRNVIYQVFRSSILDSFLNFLLSKRLTGRTRPALAGKYVTSRQKWWQLKAAKTPSKHVFATNGNAFFRAANSQPLIKATSRPKTSFSISALTVVADLATNEPSAFSSETVVP